MNRIFFSNMWTARCSCVTYLGKRWPLDTLWEEVTVVQGNPVLFHSSEQDNNAIPCTTATKSMVHESTNKTETGLTPYRYMTYILTDIMSVRVYGPAYGLSTLHTRQPAPASSSRELRSQPFNYLDAAVNLIASFSYTGGGAPLHFLITLPQHNSGVSTSCGRVNWESLN